MSTERSRPPVNKQIVEEAAEWFVELNEDDPDPATRQRFHAWVSLSPEHVRAYLKVLPMWEEGARLGAHRQDDPEALIAWSRADTNVIPLSSPSTVDRSRALKAAGGNFFRRLAIAAAVSFLFFSLAWVLVERRSNYDTGIGEQRLIALRDGSTVELNSRSKIRVRFTAKERSIDLLAGQALFRVAADPARPFSVRSGDAVVIAIGTQFDVYKKTSGTVVTVVEGRVAVSSSRLHAGHIPLSAGQQVTLAASAPLESKRADVSMATAWTQQRLVFSKAPLVAVAEEFNRYNKRQLMVEDAELKTFKVSGTFSSADPASLMRFLRAQPGIQVTEKNSEIVVSTQR